MPLAVRRARGLATFHPVRTMPIRRGAVVAVGVSLLFVAATACSSDSDGPTAESPQTAAGTPAASTEAATPNADGTQAPSTEPSGTEPAATVATAAVPEALRFTAPLVGGGTFDGAAIAGRPTVFWFWAPT